MIFFYRALCSRFFRAGKYLLDSLNHVESAGFAAVCRFISLESFPTKAGRRRISEPALEGFSKTFTGN